MKLHKLFLILTLIFFSTNIFAQNNDMKARIEFEDAETAYQSQDYQKAITLLESAEKLLGKPTAKTEYLKILSLEKLISNDNYQFEHLEQVRNYCKHYIDVFGEKTDQEKFKEVYKLNKKLETYPKTKDELEANNNQKATALENKRDAFLDFKLLSYYRDGADPSEFKQHFLGGVFSFKDPQTKKKRYGLQSADHGISFNENKISYGHNILDIKDINSSQKEEVLNNFLQEMEEFSKKYNLTPEITKTNEDNYEGYIYKFFYKNKTVQFSFSVGSYKGQPNYLKSTHITNHNYENK